MSYKSGNERYNLMVHAPEHKAKLFGDAAAGDEGENENLGSRGLG